MIHQVIFDGHLIVSIPDLCTFNTYFLMEAAQFKMSAANFK